MPGTCQGQLCPSCGLPETSHKDTDTATNKGGFSAAQALIIQQHIPRCGVQDEQLHTVCVTYQVRKSDLYKGSRRVCARLLRPCVLSGQSPGRTVHDLLVVSFMCVHHPPFCVYVIPRHSLHCLSSCCLPCMSTDAGAGACGLRAAAVRGAGHSAACGTHQQQGVGLVLSHGL